MSATLQLNFAGGVTTTSTSLTIAISGAAFAMDDTGSMDFNGSFPFSDLNFSTSTISINNPASGTALTGEIALPLIQTNSGGGDPVLTVSNFSGSVTASWPAAHSRPSEALGSGNQLTLSGFAFS